MNIEGPDVPRPMLEDAKVYATRYSLTNFINAYYQIRDCMQYQPCKILIVGVGVGLEPIILRDKFALQISTLDIDPSFNTDHVGSIHDLRMFQVQEFDVVIVSHVLEHLPFKYFEPSLKEIGRVSKHALLYLPFGGRHPELKFTGLIRFLNFTMRFTLPPLKRIDGTKPELCGGQHYWECGYRGFEVKKIRELISKHFIIDYMYHNQDWSFSLNFRLTSRQHE